MIQSQTGLYHKLELLLKKADKPLTCIDLYDVQEVRELALSPNRVSDYLGGLWRKGKVTRSAAARSDTDSSRWAYSWRLKPGEAKETDADSNEPPQLVYDATTGQRRTLLDKPEILITHDDSTVSIDLPNFTITVKIK